MNRLSVLLVALALSGRAIAGETNLAQVLPRPFVFSVAELRRIPALAPQTDRVAQEHSPVAAGLERTAIAASINNQTSESLAATNEVSLVSTEFDGVEAALYERLLRQGYFNRPTIASSTASGQWAEVVFSPEFFHWGKVDVSCSVLTAIQRRNPLCLLNPIFFQLTW